MYKNIFSILAVLLISLSVFTLTSEASPKFKDVKETYWAYDEIEWAVDKKIIYGYSDNTFLPGNVLTEAQFATVFSRYFNPSIENQVSKSNWSDKYYNYLESNGILLPGHKDSKKKNIGITRIELAKALYKSQGLTGTDNQVIDWMYENGLTTGRGKSKDKYVDFGSKDGLKRVEISSFFKRFNDKGFISLKNLDDNEGSVPVVNPAPVDPPVVNPVGSLRGQELYKSLSADYKSIGLNLVVNSKKPNEALSTSIKPIAGYDLEHFVSYYTEGDYLAIDLFAIKHKESLNLVAKSITSFGVPVNKVELENELKSILSGSGGVTVLIYGEYTVSVRFVKNEFLPVLSSYVSKM